MKRQTESGQVAMLMVAVFTAVFSVLTVGLSYVMVNTVRNSKNDTLSYNARAAAESGIEDAKRFLKYCYTHDFGHIDKSKEAYKHCDVLYVTNKTMAAKDQNCNAVLREMMKIKDENGGADSFRIDFSTVKNASGEDNILVPVGGKHSDNNIGTMDRNKENLQYYQCLRINTLTRSYEGVLSDLSTGGRSVVIPMRLVNDDRVPTKAKTIVISWHNTGDKPEGDGKVKPTPDGVTFPTRGEWAKIDGEDGSRPAVVRAQFVPVNKTNIKIDDLVGASRAITLRPTSSKTLEGVRLIMPTEELEDHLGVADPLNIEDYKMSDQPNKSKNVPLAGVICPKSGRKDEYACSAAFNFMDGHSTLFDNDVRDWFLRVNSIYSNTHFRVTAYDKDGNQLWFDGVQPSVDVTGKSAESYARVRARLEPVNKDKTGLGNWWPEYAIDTSGDICKNIVVKRDSGEIKCPKTIIDSSTK